MREKLLETAARIQGHSGATHATAILYLLSTYSPINCAAADRLFLGELLSL